MAASAATGFHCSAAIDESPARLARPAWQCRAKEGDRDALQFLYVRYSNNIYGYVRSIVRDDHEAEDVTQHVFAKLMTTIVKYDDRGVPVLRVAAPARPQRRDRPHPREPAHADRESDRSRCELADRTSSAPRRFAAALATLPDEQRQVVILRHVVGLTPGEIADRMGRTESSIHGLHHRGGVPPA